MVDGKLDLSFVVELPINQKPYRRPGRNAGANHGTLRNRTRQGAAQVFPIRRRAWRLKQIGFLFSHGGAVLLLAGGIASATYGSRGVVNLQVGDTTSDYALESGIKTKLPFSLNLQRFDVDKRPGRSAGTETIVDFASTIAAVDSAGRKNTAQIRVNAPSTWQGYSLYQASYDPKNTRLSGILVVHDPGLPLALLGLVATLLGILHILWWIPRRVATRGT